MGLRENNLGRLSVHQFYPVGLVMYVKFSEIKN